MSELEMKTEAEVEVEEFTDELSDEALDRAEGGAAVPASSQCNFSVVGGGGCRSSSGS